MVCEYNFIVKLYILKVSRAQIRNDAIKDVLRGTRAVDHT